LDVKSVGVKDDKRTYGYVCALRAVKTEDFMNASAVRIPWELLEKISGRITGEIDGITRVVYDITAKPPGTIEFE
jgi:GMP synthase (glutamine-hydrolysing)